MKHLLLGLLFVSLSLFSQEKFEKEYRVSAAEVPEKAVQLVTSWNYTKKVKWYGEESQDGKTFEAKVWYRGKKHSIEFSESGALLDVEIRIRYAEIPAAVQKKIAATLGQKMQRYRVRKVQEQYTGTPSAIYQTVFVQDASSERLAPKYELVVKGRAGKKYVQYEFLFDPKGALLKTLEFVPPNTDNLEF